MMAYVKTKLVTQNFYCKVVYDCVLSNIYWFLSLGYVNCVATK